MCCRYFIELSPELRPIIEAAQRSHLAREMVANVGKAFKSEGEIRPADMVAVIAPDKKGNKKSFPMIWGFTLPGIKGPVVNARSESASSKLTFRDSWERRRCIIPASWYYEWEHYQSGNKILTGSKYAIQPRGARTTWLAGLYRFEERHMGFKYPVFSVLTRDPSPELKKIHNRMPVILADHAVDAWIDPSTKGREAGEIVRSSLLDMVAEKV